MAVSFLVICTKDGSTGGSAGGSTGTVLFGPFRVNGDGPFWTYNMITFLQQILVIIINF